jgi:protein gp37
MGERTAIEWCDHTFNPWIGCTEVSAACDHCYARILAERYGWAKWGAGMPRHKTSLNTWMQPRTWNRKAQKAGVRRRVFCASLADVFDVEVPDAWRLDLMQLIHATPALDWLLLTKRPKVMAEFFQRQPMPANVWAGTTVESQKMADLRIPELLKVPARVRFLSVEPLLERVNLHQYLLGFAGGNPADCACGHDHGFTRCPNYGRVSPTCHVPKCGCTGFRKQAGGDGLHWIIAGGESGSKARPPHPDWFRSLRDQCAAASVPFLFKQWGEWGPGAGFAAEISARQVYRGEIQTLQIEGSRDIKLCIPTRDDDQLGQPLTLERFGKKIAGRLLDGVEHNGLPA